LRKIDIPCVIFAGGKSSRMGKDKSLLPFKESSLAKFQYERLKDIFNEVYISTKIDKFDFKADLIFDKSEIFAPTVAFEVIFEQFEEFFAISVDTPFIHRKIIEKIVQEAKKNKDFDALIAKTNFPHPLIGVYRKSILTNILNEIKKQNFKLNYILKLSKTKFIDFSDEESFLNINYPKDYEKALEKFALISQNSNSNMPSPS